MADRTTTWLGLTLTSPIVVSASPISKDVGAVAEAVAAGAGAVVMASLFEEQITNDQMALHRYFDALSDADAESASLRRADLFPVDGGPHLAHLTALRKRVSVPVVASLNGTTPGGWTSYAKRLEDAGASAIELNLYDVVTSVEETSVVVEGRQLEVVRAVVDAVKVPVNVKVGPFYSALPAFAHQLERQGALGLTVFNRFYQPDVSLETLDVDRHVTLSTSAELPLRLHALALLSPCVALSLGCTGGVHTGRDAAKAILCGAHVVQVASVLLAKGPGHVATLVAELVAWLDEQGYASVAEARGLLDVRSVPDPHAYERLNYAKMLDGWAPAR
jgi:dihydroorotate dehydrogenase (fumarate)